MKKIDDRSENLNADTWGRPHEIRTHIYTTLEYGKEVDMDLVPKDGFSYQSDDVNVLHFSTLTNRDILKMIDNLENGHGLFLGKLRHLSDKNIDCLYKLLQAINYAIGGKLNKKSMPIMEAAVGTQGYLHNFECVKWMCLFSLQWGIPKARLEEALEEYETPGTSEKTRLKKMVALGWAASISECLSRVDQTLARKGRWKLTL